MFTFLIILMMFLIMFAIIAGLGAIEALVYEEPGMSGVLFMIMIFCIVIIVVTSGIYLRNDWVQLTPDSEFSTITYKCKDIKTGTDYDDSALLIMYQDINTNFTVKSKLKVDKWMPIIMAKGNLLLMNIHQKPSEGTRVDIWLKYDHNGKYFWELLGTVDPK